MEDNQRPGIDTEHERARLNYRPERYERDIVRGGSADLELMEMPVFPSTGIESPVTRLDENISALEELLGELTERIIQENKDQKVEVPEEWKETLGDFIDFDTYKVSLDLDTPEATVIREVWESFAEDVDGNLAMEYYEDVHEIKKELETFLPFLEEHAYRPIGMKLGEADRKVEAKFMAEAESFFEEVGKTEVERKMLVLEHNLEGLSQMEDGIRLLRQEKAHIQETLQVKDEVMEVAEQKLSRHYQTLGTIEEALDEEYADGKDYLSRRASSAIDENAHMREVRGMKTLLKLALDEENEEKARLKRFSRGHLSLNKRKRLQEQLDDSLWLQKSLNSSYKEILLDEEEENEILPRLVAGSTKVQDRLEEQALAFYRAGRDEAEKRLQKVTKVQEKETTRNLYRNVRNRLRELGGDR